VTGAGAVPSLDGRRFVDATPAPAGDVGPGTVFEYRQDDDGVVWARYAGGSVRLGFLVGTRRGDQRTANIVTPKSISAQAPQIGEKPSHKPIAMPADDNSASATPTKTMRFKTM